MSVLDIQYSWCCLSAARPVQTLAAIKVDEKAFKSFRSLGESLAGRWACQSFELAYAVKQPRLPLADRSCFTIRKSIWQLLPWQDNHTQSLHVLGLVPENSRERQDSQSGSKLAFLNFVYTCMTWSASNALVRAPSTELVEFYSSQAISNLIRLHLNLSNKIKQ